jgi:integrase
MFQQTGMTGARLREILDARWDQVDIERGVIFLADSKTGRKPVYLSSAAIEVLAGLPRIEGNPYIVPGSKDSGSMTCIIPSPASALAHPWACRSLVSCWDIPKRPRRTDTRTLILTLCVGRPML